MKYSCFTRYLTAKRTLDDRSLNRYVWEQLSTQLPKGELRVLEIGAGIGTMVERALEWGLFAGRTVRYRAIDSEPTNLIVLEKRLGKRVAALAAAGVVVSAETCDLFDLLSAEVDSAQYDLIIAHAFLDLIDVPTHIGRIMSLLKPQGLLYASINFDGITSLQPVEDAALDAQIEQEYHRNMDERIINGNPSGDSQSGRHLLQTLRDHNLPILAAGSSDWVVHAQADASYVGDEAYFLHFIVDTMAGALQSNERINSAELATWHARRHAQIEQGDLIYLAHQIDVLTRRNA